MRRVLAITRNELRLYLATPLAWVLAGLFTFVAAWIFNGYLAVFQAQVQQLMSGMRHELLAQLNLTDQVMRPLIGNLGVLLLFFTPLLCMRLIAEEHATGSYALLATAPVRPIEIVAGKYLAALLVLSAVIALTLTFPLLLAHYGAGDQGAVAWPTLLSGYLGLFLLGAALVAVGLCCSALTESQPVAALVALVISLLLFLVSLTAASLEGSPRAVLQWLSAVRHLELFASGRLALASVGYFLSLTLFALFAAHRALEARRWIA